MCSRSCSRSWWRQLFWKLVQYLRSPMKLAAEKQAQTGFLQTNARCQSYLFFTTDQLRSIVQVYDNSMQSISLTLRFSQAVCNQISFGSLVICSSNCRSSSFVHLGSNKYRRPLKSLTLSKSQNDQLCSDPLLVMAAPLSYCNTWDPARMRLQKEIWSRAQVEKYRSSPLTV